jgi:uncharacterized damage-inducible protein DinB
MGEQAQALAAQFAQADDALIAAVEQCTAAQWRATCVAEGWSVAVTAHHLVDVLLPSVRRAEGLALGQPLPPLTLDFVEQNNRQHAQQYANCTQEGTAAELRRISAVAVRIIAGLADEQLDRAGIARLGAPPRSARDQLGAIVIPHILEHLASMRRAMSA